MPSPEQYFLRPQLHLGKFPETRTINVPDYVTRRIALQDAAGHLVFDDQAATTEDALSTGKQHGTLKEHAEQEVLLTVN